MTTTVTMYVGDVRDALATLPDNYADLLITSPPFLALRSYLPADHPDKHREIGSEPTPAAFMDTLFGLTTDWGRIVPEWGSICVELGDTMSGAAGYGNPDTPPAAYAGKNGERYAERWEGRTAKRFKRKDDGWPLAKSMCVLPHAYALGLAYGHNPLTGQPSPAGQWRIRNVIAWARPNPPVGSLGKRNPQRRTGDYKFRPATSYITVACRGTGRYFDLDAVRYEAPSGPAGAIKCNGDGGGYRGITEGGERTSPTFSHPAGAPPLDWHTDDLDGDWLWKFQTVTVGPKRRRTRLNRNATTKPHVSYITVACRGTGRYFDLDAVRTEHTTPDTRATVPYPRQMRGRIGTDGENNASAGGNNPAGAPPLDWHTDQLDGDWLWKLATAPYPGSHYATYPLTLPRRLLLAMCPERVCTVCGWPSERIVESERVDRNGRTVTGDWNAHNYGMRANGVGPPTNGYIGQQGAHTTSSGTAERTDRTTLGFTDCGHDAWRPGRVIDPFGGSGTTAVAAALEHRDAVLIDLDHRNIDLVRRRLADHLIIHDEQRDGDVITWTVEPASRTELEAVANGQLGFELW